jgi:hypothetical protein
MPDELSTATAEAIGRFPAIADDLTNEHVTSLMELHTRIADEQVRGAQAMREMLDLAAARGATEDHPPVEYLTPDERTSFEASERRVLDAERAAAALSEWENRSGWHEVARQLGLRDTPPA